MKYLCFFLLLMMCDFLAGQETLRVSCYNVEFSRSATPQQIGEMYKSYRLDVIGFNEVPEGNWTAQVGAVLDMPYCWVGKISSANHKDKYKSILSRYPLSDCREVVLNVPTGWNPASAVHANLKIGEKTVSFYSIHLCNNKSRDNDHARLLTEDILKNDTASWIVVGGDFNCFRTESGMKRFLNAGFKNCWNELKINVEKLFTWNVQTSNQHDGVIDHIIFKGKGRFLDGEIIEMEKPLSDHKPIRCTLELLSEELPDWAQSRIEETYERFQKWKGNDKIILFPVITDVHSQNPEISIPFNWSDSKMHLLFLLNAAKRFKADFIADLGDIGLDGPSTLEKNSAEKRIESQLKLYAGSPVAVLFAMGNHDHNGKGYHISSKMYGKTFNGRTKAAGNVIETGPDSDYGWYDLPDKKCRVIFLNTSDEGYYGFSKQQLQFVANALRVPEGYSVIVLEHFCILKEIGMWKSSPDIEAKRGNICMNIFEDFVAGAKGSEDDIAWDFTANRNTSLIAVFNGDSHYDNQKIVKGVNYIVLQGYGGVAQNDLTEGAVNRPFSRGEEMLIDVIAIKPTKKCFRVFRIGIGGSKADREFLY